MTMHSADGNAPGSGGRRAMQKAVLGRASSCMHPTSTLRCSLTARWTRAAQAVLCTVLCRLNGVSAEEVRGAWCG
ncbi:hypothetical protein C8Q74DRAFT_1235606 [Fomes fomentarius]|nr:hypothetical protein C8Q74DRAFT_1235606 [Fomes fomentarius]